MSRKSGLRASEIVLALTAIVSIICLGLIAAPPTRSSGADSTLSQAGHSNGSTAQERLNAPALPTPDFGNINYRANSDATMNGQHEPGLAVSRVHTNTVVIAQKDYRVGNVKQVWIESSTDGGMTWPVARQLQMPGVNGTLYPIQSDPVVMARDDGRIYVACLATNGSTSNGAVYITWTDDDGATWHNPSVQVSPNDPFLDDKDWFAIDNTPTSPYYHRMYMMYAPNAGIVAEQHSTDGGLTWTPRQNIGASDTEYTYPVVGSDGTVYNFMMFNWGAGQTGTVQLTKSTNGGVTWSAATTVSSAQQPGTPPGDSWRFFSIISAAVDPNNGNLYAAWTDSRSFGGGTGVQVVYVRSTNGGATWSSPTRLSHDIGNQDHITPMLAVGSDSRLHAFWLDRRDDPNNRFFKAWYSSSTDGGVTWDPDTQVSTVAFDLNVGFPPGSGNAAGDYWGLDTTANVVYAAWTDTRNTSEQDIYMAKGILGGSSGGTATPTTVPTNTPLPSATRTNTPLPTNTSNPQATNTQPPNPTATSQGTASATATTGIGATATATSASSSTMTPVGTTTATSTACTITFSDVPQTNPFYVYIRCLACRGIVNGYTDGTFRPFNNITRGQLSKILSNSAGYEDTIPPAQQTFADVPNTNAFWLYIERIYIHGVISGYTGDGITVNPCTGLVEQTGLLYFRWCNNATRGQIAKIDAEAAGYSETIPPAQQTFADVPPASTFWVYIERIALHGIIAGYPGDNITVNPCTGLVEQTGLLYFRWCNNATRGQTAKIVANTFFPGCTAR